MLVADVGLKNMIKGEGTCGNGFVVDALGDGGGVDRPVGLTLGGSSFFSGVERAHTHTDADTVCGRRGVGGH